MGVGDPKLPDLKIGSNPERNTTFPGFLDHISGRDQSGTCGGYGASFVARPPKRLAPTSICVPESCPEDGMVFEVDTSTWLYLRTVPK